MDEGDFNSLLLPSNRPFQEAKVGNKISCVECYDTCREAAKLYGLFLLHCGLLKPLGGSPCHVQVKNNKSREDCRGQCFRLWNAGEKIYTECYIPSRLVSVVYR